MNSVMAANVFESPWNIGIVGGFARDHRLELARQADVVLVAGASMSSFQTRYETAFGADIKVIRIDNEPANPHPLVSEYIRADLGPFLEALNGRVPVVEHSETWRAAIPHVADESVRLPGPLEDPAEFGPDGRLNPGPSWLPSKESSRANDQ